MRLGTVVLVVAVVVLSGFAGAETKSRGWRGDGTGRFPDAEAPLTWSRISKTVADLRNSAAKLDEADLGRARAIPHGTIREWLILGPLPVDAEATEKALVEAEQIEREAQLQPAEGDKVGEVGWKKVETTGTMLHFNEHIEGLDDQVVYACTYLHSPQARRVFLQLGMSAGKFWVNGEMLFSRLKSGDERPNCKTVVTLRKGWNTILVKTLANKKGQQFGGSTPGTAYVKLSLYGVDPDETFETTHILWQARLPEAGVVFKQRFSCFQPIIVGDRVFVASDPGFLICYDKNTGRRLWMHDTTAYDFVTDEERAADPETFAKIDADMTQFRQIARTVTGGLKERFELTRLCHEIRTALKKVNAEKYHYDTRQEPGNAAQPVTDGRFVYAWCYNNIAACFDLDGNRIWKAYVHEEGPQGRHGYYRCPMLIGDDFAVEVRNHIIGFDRKTGKINWRIPYKFNTYSTYNQEVRERSDETDIVSFRDMGLYKPGVGFVAWSSVVPSGDSLYGDGCHRNTLIRHRMTGGGDAPFEIKRVLSRGTDVGKIITPGTYWSRAIGTAGFLVHDGLLYAMGFGGVLRVFDAETLTGVYERQLDFAPVTHAYPYPYGAGVCASPTLGGRHIYLWGVNGTTIVIEPGRTFKQVAKNHIESAVEGDLFTWQAHYTENHYYPECTVSSPVFDGKRIYYRAEEYLYCIGEK
ncbi:MAG TPA: PQQ-binding-like beta-propeller repeat protein [Planctomycetota bacterium]|nr:PQQ-binding-like beta-propeller repeat protein [Planctomycetota bacterium]